MFSSDRFHPSPAGYARAAAALLPSVCAALGIWVGEPEPAPDRRRGEGVGPVAVAAVQAVRDPGTEVSAAAVGGQVRGPRGLWAVLRRRPHEPVTDRGELTEVLDTTTVDGDGAPTPAATGAPAGAGAPASAAAAADGAVDGVRDEAHTRPDPGPQ
jgi:hypothetical protein